MVTGHSFEFVISIHVKTTVANMRNMPLPFLCTLKRGTIRTNQQNRYLFGVAYDNILAHPELEGWTKEDLHDFFLIKVFGSEVIEFQGHKRHKALKRSSRLSTDEFSGFVDYIIQFAAERLGIVIPPPEDKA